MLADDPDERLVTDTLLDRLDIELELDALVEALVELLEHASAAATHRAYQADLAHLTSWCAARSRPCDASEPVAAVRRKRARRDRALLLVGYAAATRRSELVALNIDNVRENEHGLVVFIARSKTDQTGMGDFVGIAHGHPQTVAPSPARSAPGRTGAALVVAAGDPLPPGSPAIPPRLPGTVSTAPRRSSTSTPG